MKYVKLTEIKVLAVLVGRLSLSAGLENGPERELRLFL